MMEVMVNEQDWFKAMYDGVTPELREAFIERNAKEIFALLVDIKMCNRSNKAYHGYVGQFPGMDYETLSIADVQLVASCTKLRVIRLRERETAGMSSETRHHKLDFSGLSLEKAGTPEWDRVRAEMMEVVVNEQGWFEAVYDGVAPELREALFDRSLKELFELPVDVKMRNTSNKANHGYIGQFPGMDYEALSVADVHLVESTRSFTELMWPEGNPSFWSDHTHPMIIKAYTYTSVVLLCQLSQLEKMVRRMLLECLGVVKYFDRQNSELTFNLRMARYGALTAQEADVSLPPHVDGVTVTLVVQHKVAGLQVLTADGEWLAVPPSPNSNGRLRAQLHRVMVGGEETRYSAIFGSLPKDDVMVEVPEELVDEEHPLMYKPFNYPSFVNFTYLEKGAKSNDTLKAYCGVQQDDEVGA
ncbi:hypothetical protein B296_00046322 [Ensete ventricosum]|uniref:Isopenicillin N synthase-like Fe(2+) 2OG dioxygenase domain-containing protein n=1 Tax=Ensete ventricosum TaxID=4639 RepID=A0A426X7E4_ENSVE|nr:hypothetical protein B296_00046322 [Ensete ventricosum]